MEASGALSSASDFNQKREREGREGKVAERLPMENLSWPMCIWNRGEKLLFIIIFLKNNDK